MNEIHVQQCSNFNENDKVFQNLLLLNLPGGMLNMADMREIYRK